MLASWAARIAATSLPLLAVALAKRALRPYVRDWRERWLLAGAGGAVWLALSSEVLGSIGYLHRRGVLLAWWVAAAAAALAARRSPTVELEAPGEAARPISHADRALFAATLAVLATLLFVALCSTPNSADAMAYHLPRVARWIARASLAPFVVADPRQLEFAPLGELMVLHTMVLWGTDRLAQSVHWLAMVGSLLASAATAARLGAGRLGQWIAAAFILSVPMATLLATSAQNEVLVSAWIALLALAVLAARRERRWLWVAGAAAGLAIYTKGTAYLFTAPLLAWALLDTWAGRTAPRSVAERRLARAGRAVVALAVPIVLLNGAHWLRNERVFGSPLGSKSLRILTMAQAHDPLTVVSSLVRGLSLHANVPGAGPRGTALAERTVRRLHAVLGRDVDDRRATMLTSRYGIVYGPFGEYAAGAGWHLLLALALAMAYGAARWRRKEPPAPGLLPLALAALGGLILLSAGVPWQPTIARLQLPFFALLAPVAGWLADRLLAAAGAFVLALGLVVSAVPAALFNSHRPLVGPQSILRTDPTTQLFADFPSLRLPVTSFVSRIEATSCRSIGRVHSWRHEPEYALWRLLNGPARTPHRYRIEDLNVLPEIAGSPHLSAPPEPFVPCATIRFRANRLEVLSAPWLPAAQAR